MPIIAYSLTHETAALDIREKVAFAPDHASRLLRDLLTKEAAHEAVILSTCNRTEIYAHSQDVSTFQSWLEKQPEIYTYAPIAGWSAYLQQDAVCHAMRVACGLESMILGEPQILGQMKAAFTLAQQNGAIGNYLYKLFQAVFTTTKHIRTHTGIGTSPVSVAYAAVKLAKQIFANLAKCSVLLIGAGQTIELTGMHLVNTGVKRIIVANRSLPKAKHLANKFQAHAITMSDIPVHLPEVDIVITSTASSLPILGKGMIESALKIRKHRPVFMVDLAVPRDVEPEVAGLGDVYLYNIDDLQHIIADNLNLRKEAAGQAEAIIEIQAKWVMREIQALNSADIIRDYRSKMTQIRDDEITKALQRLKKGQSAELVLTHFAHSLINKATHTPTTQMRQLGLDGKLELLILARRLLGI